MAVDNGEAAAAVLAEKLAERAAPPPKPKREYRRVEGPGLFHDLPVADYHQDPAPEPSLSCSVGLKLITKTPFHAWMAHPRLTAEYREEEQAEEESNAKQTLGSLVHELLAGRGRGIRVLKETQDSKKARIEAPRTWAHAYSKEWKQACLEEGYLPCLQHELDAADEMALSIRADLDGLDGCRGAFVDGQGEVTAVWREEHLGVWCRMLMDWWGPAANQIFDLKTKSTDLTDETLSRQIKQDNLAFRAAWYERGLTRLYPELAGRVTYTLLFVENKEPFLMRPVRLGPHTMMRGHKQVAHALGLWARCLEQKRFPAYPKGISYLDEKIYGASDEWTIREETDLEVRENILRDPFVSASATPERRSPLELDGGIGG